MGLGDFWLQSNNGKKISLDNLKELKKSDLKNNPELIKLFDIFNTNKSNGSEEVLDKQELNSLFNTFSKAAQSQKGKNTSIFETEEAEDFINSNSVLQESKIKTSDLFDFLSKIVKPQNEQKTISKPSRKTKTNQEVKAGVIESLRSDSDETLKIISNMNNGDISDIYDSVKTFLDMDTSKAKVLEAAVNQAQGAKYMEKAQSGGLTREEYIKANKQRLQDMMKARLYKKDKNGIDYLDKNRADLKMSRKEFEALMLATIERMTDDMDIKSVKEKMRQLPMTTENGDRFLMDSIKQNTIVLFGKAKSAGCSTLDLATKYIYDTTKIVKPSPDDKKLLTFDEVFYYEQGVNYSKEDCEKYLDVQTQLTKNLSSYNKYLEFKTGADKILKEKDAEKALNDVIKLFEQFYSDPSYPNLAYKNIKSVVKNSNLPINVTQDETGRISMSMVSGSEDLLLSYVSDILAAEGNIQQERLDKVFGGNAEEKLEELQKEVEQAHEKAYGNDFSSTLGKAMIEDNQTFIQRYTGNASMTGMGLTVVGGVLCFTPAAALGAAMVTAGNILAIGGMAAESGLGFYEASTRKHGAEDGEYEELTKTMLMNLGGFGFGGAAGKTGMKLFNKFVSKELDSLPKLSEAFKSAMVKGNRAEALKIVCSQPEYRKQFAKGLASKLLSDFSISYAGDLVMMGVLDTQDDWESLLQSNLIGILAGMGGDIKDAAHLGMKGDKYRALKKKEQEGTITQKEIKELALLRQDADVRNLSGVNEGVNFAENGVRKASFNIPAVKLRAHNSIFAETPQAFCDVISRRVNDFKKLLSEKDDNLFYQKVMDIFIEEMGIEGIAPSLILGTHENARSAYDNTNNTISIFTNNFPEGRAMGVGIIAHELKHFIQFKEMLKTPEIGFQGVIEANIENVMRSNSSVTREQAEQLVWSWFTDSEGEIKPHILDIMLYEGYPENEINDMYGKLAQKYAENEANYVTKTESLGIDGTLNAYQTQIVEAEAYDVSDAVATHFNKTVLGINKPIQTRETSNVSHVAPDKNLAQKVADGKSTSSQTDTQTPKQHIVVGNKLFELNSKFGEPTKDAIEEVKAEIERLSKTEPEKADNLQIVLDMFITPTEAKKVTETQIDAVVKYLDEHYGHKENYLTTQVKKLGLDILGKFGHRMKGLESTRDKVANYIADAIKDENEAIKNGENFTPKTLLDAFNDVRDKYACRTVFEMGDYTKAPTVANLINEAKALKLQGKIKEANAKMHEAELEAAELQSKDVTETIKQSILKAKENDADLNVMRISNYVSPDGIPILSESQLSEIKYFAAQQGINVEFIRLASEIDPSLTPEQRKEQEKKLTTKSQPSGYTALQINFVTKTGEVIEWQFRGELVDRFAEAEHLPYDLRTGKHPWKQIPELEPLYKPIADLLNEDVMPKHAYKQINRYFTDYYTHLRRLELGFESTEPKLEDYENYRAKDENGVERDFSYKFDKRLEAKNLMTLHDLAEGYKDGLVTPEGTVVELNRTVAESPAKTAAIEIKSNTDNEQIAEVLNIFNTHDGLKNIQENIKAELSRFIGNSKAEYRDEMVKLIDRLKNAKQRYGKDTLEYTDEQLLEIIKVASNPDGTLNLTVLQRICKRMDGGPREDNSKMTRILPMDTKEHNLARRSDGFYDEDLVEIGKKLMYAHETREEIFKLLKDENGNPVKELTELIKTDKNEDFDDGEMLLNALRVLYTDGRLDLNKVNQMQELVKGGLTMYGAAGAMQSGMPANIVENMPVFAKIGLSRSDINSIVEYLKNKNIEPTFETVKNTVENCGDIPEFREIHIKHLLNLRGETINNSIYNNVRYLSERVNEYYKRHPELAENKPDLEAQFIKLLYIEGRTTQLTQREIMDLLGDFDTKGKPRFDVDKLVDSGVFRDIPGRRKPLSKNELAMLQKEDIEVLKKAVEKGLLSDNYMQLCNLSFIKHIMVAGGKSKLQMLTELSDTELKNLTYMDWADLDFSTAISLAKCDPKKVDFVLDAMNIYTVPDYQKILLRDFNVDLAYKLFKEIDPHTTFPDSSVSDKVNDIIGILFVAKPHNIDEINYMYDNRAELGITTSQIKELVSNQIKARDIKRLAKKIGKENISKLDEKALPVAIRFADYYKVNDINELSVVQKRKLRTKLTECNGNLFDPAVQQLKKLFPLLPKDQTEYCSTMRDIVNSMGIETKPLSETQVRKFNESSLELGQALGIMSDSDFSNLRITQEYSREDFIKTVLEKTKDLPKCEKLKVYDYFGFELHSNETNPTGYTLTGYPANINNGAKLAKIKSEATRQVVENLRSDVVRFSENNKIKCNDPQTEKLLNQVMETLPELRTMIGRTQHGTHDFDVMQHTLKVLQKITQEPYFKNLNESDKKVVTLATLMHDMTKTEGKTDATHAIQGSFDGFFISKKFNLTREEGIKMYTLMNMHEWLSFVNKPIADYELNNYIKEYNKNHSKSEQITHVTPDVRERLSQEVLTKRLQSVAFDLQQDNLFELSLMFTHADLKAVKKDDYFHDTVTMPSCATFDGKKRVFEVGNGQKVSHGQAADIYAERIRGYVDELKKTRPLTPVTKVPDSETIRSRITQINPDGSTNSKGVFVDKDGLIVIKFNDVEDWEALGFPRGTTTKGIKGTGRIKKESGYIEESEFETGNFKFFAHALNYANQLSKFDSFALPDSDALLSVTYMERPESKYRNFNTQGIGLYVQSKYVHGGGNTDAGSGTGKSISEFKKNYIFGGKREKDRTFTADIVKRATGMSDEQYVQFYEKNKNNTWEEVEPIDGSDPIEFRNKLIKAYAENIVSNERGDRAYDEYYVTNPEEPMFAWVYASDKNEKIGPNPLEFLHRNNKTDKENKIGRIGHTAIRPVEERTQFLREYCLNRNKVMFVFGD